MSVRIKTDIVVNTSSKGIPNDSPKGILKRSGKTPTQSSKISPRKKVCFSSDEEDSDDFYDVSVLGGNEDRTIPTFEDERRYQQKIDNILSQPQKSSDTSGNKSGKTSSTRNTISDAFEKMYQIGRELEKSDLAYDVYNTKRDLQEKMFDNMRNGKYTNVVKTQREIDQIDYLSQQLELPEVEEISIDTIGTFNLGHFYHF